jgi:hypothetical protein
MTRTSKTAWRIDARAQGAIGWLVPRLRDVLMERPQKQPCATRAARAIRGRAVAATAIAALGCDAAHASFLSGETLDAAANVLAWVVLCIVPIIAIVVFWLVHVLPEKIAHRRHHPQTQAIQTLCLLSLVFGGLLWPLAWLWAYTRPVGYKVAYGTDKHDDYFAEATEKARRGALTDRELAELREELDAMEARGTLPSRLRRLRDEIASQQDEPPVLEAEVTAARADVEAAVARAQSSGEPRSA